MYFYYFCKDILYLYLINSFLLCFTVESSYIKGRIGYILNNNIVQISRVKKPVNIDFKSYSYGFSENEINPLTILEDSCNYTGNNKVTITNKQNKFKINEKLLIDVSKLYKSKLKLEDFRLDIFMEDLDNMIEINKKELGYNEPTDIISIRDNIKYTKLSYYKNKCPSKNPDHYHMGEIFLCPEYIKIRSDSELNCITKNINYPLKIITKGGVYERVKGIKDLDIRMSYILAHGMLHLIGYDHNNEEELIEMKKMEDFLIDEILKEIN